MKLEPNNTNTIQKTERRQHYRGFSKRKMSWSACSEVRQLRFAVITFPDVLKRRSDRTLVASKEKIFWTSLLIRGYRDVRVFHQAKGFESSSAGRSAWYSSSSFLTLSENDGDWLCCSNKSPRSLDTGPFLAFFANGSSSSLSFLHSTLYDFSYTKDVINTTPFLSKSSLTLMKSPFRF